MFLLEPSSIIMGFFFSAVQKYNNPLENLSCKIFFLDLLPSWDILTG